jgi:hypothetical protein
LRLLQRGPVLQGLPWYKAFFEPGKHGFIDADPRWHGSGLELDTSDAFNSTIIYVNSWGASWADAGRSGCVCAPTSNSTVSTSNNSGAEPRQRRAPVFASGTIGRTITPTPMQTLRSGIVIPAYEQALRSLPGRGPVAVGTWNLQVMIGKLRSGVRLRAPSQSAGDFSCWSRHGPAQVLEGVAVTEPAIHPTGGALYALSARW